MRRERVLQREKPAAAAEVRPAVHSLKLGWSCMIHSRATDWNWASFAGAGMRPVDKVGMLAADKPAEWVADY